MAPLQYREPVLVYTRLGDPRFADVINGSIFWKIVGTTNILAIERCKQYKLVIRLSANVETSDVDVRKILHYRTRRLLQKLEAVLNDLLEEDPYSDILSVPIPEEYFASIVDSKSKYLGLKDAVSFQFTMTFAFWRRSIMMRDALRDSFLSVMPDEAVADRELDELAAMEAGLREIEERFPRDAHLIAVARRHAHLVRKERRRQMRLLD
jgi:hypothetical protein